METIETKRLLLRPFRESDYEDLYEFLAQLRDDEFEGYPDITRENGRKHHLSERLGSEEYFAMELRESGKVIGNIFCGKRDFDAREVGYIVNRDYRRQGYALEALEAVAAWAFRSGVHRVYAECDPRNECSWKLLEAAGFRREARLRQNVFFQREGDGKPIWKDTFVYARLEGDVHPRELELYIPRPEDLWFYEKMHADPATMAYNAPWVPPDGCIPFPRSDWDAWYEKWIGREPERFYAYLRRPLDRAFVGSLNFRRGPDPEQWDMGILIYAPERGKGYGRQGLALLLDRAFRVDGIPRLHNNFEPTRDAARRIHLAAGFREIGIEDGILQLELTREEYEHGKFDSD